MLNKTKFVETMTGIAGMFNVNMTEWILETYYDIFKDYNIEQFNKAVKEVLKDLKYHVFPKPAEILSYLEGTSADKATVAWVKVLDAIKLGGYYATIEFDDPVISHCINHLGGWMWLCSQLKEDMPFIEKRFKDLYNTLSKRGVTQGQTLIGFFEGVNKETGFPEDIPAPVKIGDSETQKRIGKH